LLNPVVSDARDFVTGGNTAGTITGYNFTAGWELGPEKTPGGREMGAPKPGPAWKRWNSIDHRRVELLHSRRRTHRARWARRPFRFRKYSCPAARLRGAALTAYKVIDQVANEAITSQIRVQSLAGQIATAKQSLADAQKALRLGQARKEFASELCLKLSSRSKTWRPLGTLPKYRYQLRQSPIRFAQKHWDD
jgi:hypothetical protein